MTEEELQGIKKLHGTALSIWLDRRHECSTVTLTEALLYYMPAWDLLDALGHIDNEIKEDRDYERNH